MHARAKGVAIEMLNEWSHAEKATLSRMTDCMFDFRLGDDGKTGLADVREFTKGCFLKSCCPHLNPAFAKAGWASARAGH